MIDAPAIETDALANEAALINPLDLLSTSQKIGEKIRADVEFEFEQSRAVQADVCHGGAPFICYRDIMGKWHLVQGCCNDWLCPRCGQIRARHEFGRIVNGAKGLTENGHKLNFVTLTCRGREMPLEEAQENYLKWTNRLLSAMRAQAKKGDDFWCYVQVTERQKRQHPHSHLITTFLPDDAVLTYETRKGKDGQEYQAEIYVSKWFIDRNKSAGLGSQCRIEPVHNPIGLAAYVAKYLFKDCMTTEWPSGWKRVRYSQSWPELPSPESLEAFPVVKPADWQRVAAIDAFVYADSQYTYERALARLVVNILYKSK